MAADLARVTGVREERIAVLPNPVDVEGIRAAAEDAPSTVDRARAASAGGGQAGAGEGIRPAAAGIGAASAEDMRMPMLMMAGAGPERAGLKELAAELGVGEAVRFAGHVEVPSSLLAGASLFVLSSRQEGMPNALLEAAAGGLPLVATPASERHCELLQGQPGVWLAGERSAEPRLPRR